MTGRFSLRFRSLFATGSRRVGGWVTALVLGCVVGGTIAFVAPVASAQGLGGFMDGLKRALRQKPFEVVVAPATTPQRAASDLEKPGEGDLGKLADCVARRIEVMGGAVTKRTVEAGQVRLEGRLERPSEEGLRELLQPHTLTLSEVKDIDASAYWQSVREKGAPLPTGIELSRTARYGWAPEGQPATTATSKDRAALLAFLAKHPQEGLAWAVEPKSPDPKPGEPGMTYSAHLLAPPGVEGRHVAQARVDFSAYDNRPYIAVTLTKEGGALFEALTAEVVKRRVAIVIDGDVISAPVVQEKISGGRLQITLGWTQSPSALMREAQLLAAAIDAGGTPCDARIVSFRLLD